MFDFLTAELIAFQHFHFLRPYWLLILIPYILIFTSFTQRDDDLVFWRQVMSTDILDKLTVKGSRDTWLSPKNAMGVIALVSCIVLTGPTWRQQASPFTQDKSALIIALDVSETMDQTDVQPSRLLRAKQKIIELMALRGDANTALIAYAGSAHTVMPITNDSEMIRHFLDFLDNRLIPLSGKLPQAVLPLADDLFQPTGIPGTLLIVGDGATNDTVDKFEQFFAAEPHQLIVWAIGNVQPSTERQSSVVPMQLSQLEALADNSQGRLVLMTYDKRDVGLGARYIENNLVIVEDASRPWLDAGYPLVFLIALLFLLWFRRGWTLQW